MEQRVRFSSILVFLIAVASNCILASQIGLDFSPSPLTALENSTSSRADDGQFLIADDDDSDQTVALSFVQYPILSVVEPVLFSLNVLTAVVAGVHTKHRSTVLTL
jgi:hypothetical protein